MAPALEQIESVDELRTALNDPAELLEKLLQSTGPKLEKHFTKEHQRENVHYRSSNFLHFVAFDRSHLRSQDSEHRVCMNSCAALPFSLIPGVLFFRSGGRFPKLRTSKHNSIRTVCSSN